MVSDEPWRRFTPLSVSPQSCMARVWGGGLGGQCTKTPVAGGAGLCQSHARQSRAGGGLSHGRVDGPVPGPKLAEFEQVAAARRAKSSRPGENPLQRGAKRNIASGQIVPLCASREAVKSSEASVAAAQAAARTLQELASQSLPGASETLLPRSLGSREHRFSCRDSEFHDPVSRVTSTVPCLPEAVREYGEITTTLAAAYDEVSEPAAQRRKFDRLVVVDVQRTALEV